MPSGEGQLQITEHLSLPLEELEWSAIRAQGAGGQNVNKVSSALHMRFDISASSLPDAIKERLLAGNDSRISKDGVLTLKAQRFRTQEANREDALARLREILLAASHVPKARKATRPTRASKARRMDAKNRRGRIKNLRGRVSDD